MSIKIYSEADSDKKIFKGVELMAKTVGSTMGPGGRLVAITMNGATRFTKDGVTVAKAISSDDAAERVGMDALRQVAMKTCDTQGDGTTTSTVLAAGLFNLAKKLQSKSEQDITREIVRSMDKIKDSSLEYIKDNSLKITTDSADIEKVASISTNGDSELITMIGQAYRATGENCEIEIKRAFERFSSVSVNNGASYDRGMISQLFANDKDRRSCFLDNPYVLLYEGTLSTAKEVSEVIKGLNNQDSLLIICSDVIGEARTALVGASRNISGNYCAINAPNFGLARIDAMRDLAVMTGGDYIESEKGLSLRSIGREANLGRIKSAKIGLSKTVLVSGRKMDDEEITERAKFIQEDIDSSTSKEMKDKHRTRLANFKQSIATIHLGAETDAEYEEKFDRLEDAIGACRAAVSGGVVKGGGTTMFEAYKEILSSNKTDYIDHTLAIALSHPLFMILDNAHIPKENISQYLAGKLGKKAGYNARTGVIVEDMNEIGIVDPADVVSAAIINAVSAAKLLLSTNSIITLE